MGDTASKKLSCLNLFVILSWNSPFIILASTGVNRNDNVFLNNRSFCGFCTLTPERNAWSYDSDRLSVFIFFRPGEFDIDRDLFKRGDSLTARRGERRGDFLTARRGERRGEGVGCWSFGCCKTGVSGVAAAGGAGIWLVANL